MIDKQQIERDLKTLLKLGGPQSLLEYVQEVKWLQAELDTFKGTSSNPINLRIRKLQEQNERMRDALERMRNYIRYNGHTGHHSEDSCHECKLQNLAEKALTQPVGEAK